MIAVRWEWALPLGHLALGCDALSLAFLVPLGLVLAIVTPYAVGYMRPKHGHGAHDRGFWPAFGALALSMALVVVARDGVLFLVAWEIMAISSFFLVAHEHEREEVRQASLRYLIASHLGMACLLPFFLLMARHGTLFSELAAPPGMASVLFVLALAGFGAKAGIVPVHVWLPDAHPAAPSPVSAVMSGLMIKMGLYGLLRALTLLGSPLGWWGWTLIAVGVVSAVFGAAQSLAQSDLKRLLAYSSVENMGLMVTGVGVGVLGWAHGQIGVAALGFAGALWHAFNHAAFKSLLFMGAGAVVRETGLRDLDRLGGLMKVMPQTGTAFLFGAMALAALPPMNAFGSEFLLYEGAFKGATSLGTPAPALLLGVLAMLAFTGAIALALSAKAFGAAFLGTPRQALTDVADPPAIMLYPMGVLAVLCVAVGMAAPWLPPAPSAPIGVIMGPGPVTLGGAIAPLSSVSFVSALGLAIAGGLFAIRRSLLAGRPVRTGPTWGCGYGNASPRLQYTATSFSQPLAGAFRAALRPRIAETPVAGLFPAGATFATTVPDVADEAIYRSGYRLLSRSVSRLRWIQHGNVQLYVLYVALTLIVLLVWVLG